MPDAFDWVVPDMLLSVFAFVVLGAFLLLAYFGEDDGITPWIQLKRAHVAYRFWLFTSGVLMRVAPQTRVFDWSVKRFAIAWRNWRWAAEMMLVVTLLFVGGCTNETDSRRALQSLGFTDIQFTGYEVFGCSEGDDYSTGFQATGQDGKRVSGVVCCGVLKSCTVRF